MAYTINRTNGLNSITIPDGQINTSTSVTLVGKNYPNYGAILDQNFLRMLENFANTSAPSSPIAGQLWWDSANKTLKVNLDGTPGNWKNVGSTTAQALKPTGNNNVGDLWWETNPGRLWAYDSLTSDYKLIGPIGGSAGISADPIPESPSVSHPAISFQLGGITYAILSSDPSYVPNPPISGFTRIYPGLNLAGTSFLLNARFTGTATVADTLASSPSNLTATSFMRTDVNTSTTGTVSVINNTGMTIGTSNNLKLSVAAPNVAVLNQTQSGAINFRVTNSGNNVLNAVDIYPNGNLVANYDFTVAGNINFSNSSNDLVITGASASTNYATGALRLSQGGLGIAGNINSGGSQSNFVGTVRAANFISNSSITGATIGNTGTLLTGTLQTAAQPSITSVGTLTGLTVTGLISVPDAVGAGVAGKITVNAQPYITSIGTLSSLTVSSGAVSLSGASSVTLGAVGSVKITGGTSGQYLQTDGSGNLTWASITGTNNQIAYFSSGTLAGTNNFTWNGSTLYVNGALNVTGDVTAFYSSDKNLKTDIVVIDRALDKVSLIKGVTFNWNDKAEGKDTSRREAGVIAQDLEKVLPEAVITRDNGVKAVDYDKIIPLLIEAIKDLKAEVEALKTR
jgi:hypothetical protein